MAIITGGLIGLTGPGRYCSLFAGLLRWGTLSGYPILPMNAELIFEYVQIQSQRGACLDFCSAAGCNGKGSWCN
ncbi:MAG: hypothetical protein RSE25_10180 [Bacteroidales bacterium]